MVSYAQRSCSSRNDTDNKKSSGITFHKTHPKRNISPKNYVETEEPANDRYVYCDNCEEDCVDYCVKCGMLIVLKDNPVPMGVEMRARKTVPKGILEIRQSTIHGLGVFAVENIQKGVRMGPYEGVVTRVDTSLGYAWKLRGGRLIDASNENNSNYLRYVNCARNVSEQNIIAYQYQGELYYRNSRNILKGEELLVYYGHTFAKKLGINPQKYFEPIEEKSEPEFFTCKHCHVGLKTKDFRNRHELRCRFNPIKMKVYSNSFACRHCESHLTSKEFLDNHEKFCKRRMEQKQKLETFECEVEKKQKCRYCEYATKHKGCLKRHILTIHEKENAEIFYCKNCDYQTLLKMNLRRHLKIHEENHTFTCNECEKGFNMKPQLDNHYLRKHSEINHCITSKIHCCDFCSYKTVYTTDFRRHKCTEKIESQIGQKNTMEQYICLQCNYMTNYKCKLRVHLQKHQNENKPYICDECKKTFNQKTHLDRHIFNNHKSNELLIKSISSKIYCCKFCNYQSVVSTRIKSHMLIHTQEKPHVCPECKKGFNQKLSLQSHIVSNHSNNDSLMKSVTAKIHTCGICNYYKTLGITHFKKHLQTHLK